MHAVSKSACVIAGTAVLLGGASSAFAAGFALKEQSGAALGNAFAGATAEAGDVSYSFFNPAGLSRHEGAQGALVGNVIVPDFQPDDMQARSVTGAPIGGGDGTSDAAADALTAATYGSISLDERLTLGLAVNSPFGLVTEYNHGWAGRYHALDSELLTFNVNPMIAYEATDWLALGAGAQAQYADARLTNAIDFGSIGAVAGVPFAQPGRQDGHAEVEGDDWGFGFNLGALFTLSETTRVGIGYRSRVEHELDADADFTLDDAGVGQALQGGSGTFRDTGAQASLSTPDMLSLGAYHEITPQWAVMGEVQWTNWSTFDELRIRFDNPAQRDSVTEENWEDAFFVALGATYRPTDAWTLRAGVAHDESPIPDSTRTPRVPGGDRTWLTAGVGYEPLPGVTLDIGYAHIFVEDTTVDLSANDPGNTFRGDLSGRYDNGIDLISVQMTARF